MRVKVLLPPNEVDIVRRTSKSNLWQGPLDSWENSIPNRQHDMTWLETLPGNYNNFRDGFGLIYFWFLKVSTIEVALTQKMCDTRILVPDWITTKSETSEQNIIESGKIYKPQSLHDIFYGEVVAPPRRMPECQSHTERLVKIFIFLLELPKKYFKYCCMYNY